MTPLSREMSKDAEYALKDRYDARNDARKYHYDNLLKHDLDGDGVIDADEREYARQEKEAAIEAKRNSGKKPRNGDEGKNYYQDQFDRGLNFFTYGDAGDPPETEEQVQKNSTNAITQSMKNTKELRDLKSYGTIKNGNLVEPDKTWIAKRDEYLKNHTAKGLLDQDVLTKSVGRSIDGSRSHCVFTTDGDIDRLYDADEIVSNTLGAKGTKPRLGTDRSDLDKFRAGQPGADKLKM